MASLMTNNQIFYEQYFKNCKYLFAYYCCKSKVWYVQPRKFIVQITKDRLYGQFLQSIWFNVLYKKNESPIFVVLCVDESVSFSTVEKDMNSLKNPFPSVYDIPPYVKKHSYFSMTWGLLNKCIEEVNTNKDDIKFTIRAINNPWDLLEMSIYGDDSNKNQVLFSLPYFVCKI